VSSEAVGLGHCAGLWPDDVGVLPERRVLGLGLCKLFYAGEARPGMQPKGPGVQPAKK
jgi:hypothetical protein